VYKLGLDWKDKKSISNKFAVEVCASGAKHSSTHLMRTSGARICSGM
jgi:hypothetical protein